MTLTCGRSCAGKDRPHSERSQTTGYFGGRPYRRRSHLNAILADNWDLSVKRATSVVRLLQQKYAIAPQRMTAGGRSEFVPKTFNSTVEGKALNRRTEIIILPKLDEFFELWTQQPIVRYLPHGPRRLSGALLLFALFTLLHDLNVNG